jgi:hypothetical protein
MVYISFLKYVGGDGEAGLEARKSLLLVRWHM